MADRHFERRTDYDDGAPVYTSVIECRQCGAKERFKHIGPTKPHDLIVKSFQAKGWHVGNTFRKDLCPDCVTKARGAKKEKRAMAYAAKHDNVVSMKADPPKELGRDERRIIFAKIDENYLDAVKGYAPPWTDAAIARDLGVPPSWVAQVRDEMFGPAGSNPEYDAFMEQVGLVKAEFVRIEKMVTDAGDAQRRSLTELADRLAGLEKVARSIEKQVAVPPARRG